MHPPRIISRCLPAILALALTFPAHATRDPEFPPNTIVVLASDSSLDADMAAKFTGKVDYICDGTNDQVEIQKAIDNVYDPPTNTDPDGAAHAGQGGTVLLVGGKFNISDTIVIQEASALTIRGMGARGSAGPNGVYAVDYGGWNDEDNTTALSWTGAADGTMIRLENSYACTLENLLFFGMNGEESNVAGKLIHVTAPDDEIGSGEHRLINLHLFNADSGLVLGDDAEDLGCGGIYAERIAFARLSKGVVLKAPQSRPHTFVDVKSGCSTAVFYVEHGGNITVLGGSDTGSGAYVQLTGGDDGADAEPILIQGVRMETAQNSNYTPVLIKGGGDIMSVSFVGCAVLGGLTSYNDYSIDISDGVAVTARDCVFSGKVAKLDSSSGSAQASLILDGCAVPLLTEDNDAQWTSLLSLGNDEYNKLKVLNCRSYDTPRDVIEYNGLAWPDVNQPAVFWSDVVDARNTGTVTLPVYGKGDGGKDTVFVPTEVGLQVVTLPTGITGAPSFQWGWSSNHSGLHSATVYSVPGVDSVYAAPVTSSGNFFTGRTDDVTATVATGATVTSGQPLYVRFFWKGYIQRTQ